MKTNTPCEGMPAGGCQWLAFVSNEIPARTPAMSPRKDTQDIICNLPSCPTGNDKCPLKLLLDAELEFVKERIQQLYHCLAEKFVTKVESDGIREIFEVKIRSVERATTVASASMEHRLEGMNEFRAQLKDQVATFVSRDEFSIVRDKIDSDVRILRESKAAIDGKASMSAMVFSYIIAVIGLLTGVVGIIISIARK
jgi:hypothetical protein